MHKRFQNLSMSVLVVIVLFASSCGLRSTVNEGWTLVALITKGERNESVAIAVDARNCSFPERRTVTCSVDKSSNYVAGVDAGLEAPIHIGSSIAAEIGFSHSSGQGLELAIAPAGYVNRYIVTKEYHIISGEALARLSEDDEQTVPYTFRVDCSIEAELVETLSCAEADGAPLPPTAAVEPRSIPHTPRPTLVRPTAAPVGANSTLTPVSIQIEPHGAGGAEPRVLRAHAGGVLSVACSPDGAWLASGGDDGHIWLWDAASGQAMRWLIGHTADVKSVAWSPDGTQLASGSWDGSVRTWDAISGQELLVLKGRGGSVLSVAWSSDGTQLASGCDANVVQVWDAANGREVAAFQGHTGPVRSVAWSPTASELASASLDNTVRVWGLEDGQVKYVLVGHTADVNSVAWSLDGTWLASASDDGTVRVWDGASGQASLVLEAHTDPVLSVAWSPSGAELASASLDRTVRIWNLADRRVSVLNCHGYTAWSVAWAPGGDYLDLGGDDGAVRVWSVTGD